MTEDPDPRDGAVRLAFAFRVGAVGSIIFGTAALTTATLATLLALAVWTVLTLFGFQLFYDWAVAGDSPVTVPNWFLKGPHQ